MNCRLIHPQTASEHRPFCFHSCVSLAEVGTASFLSLLPQHFVNHISRLDNFLGGRVQDTKEFDRIVGALTSEITRNVEKASLFNGQ